MIYEVALKKSSEGYAVWCPALPGCASQGGTKAEALANIRDAISAWLRTARRIAMKQGKLVRVKVAA